MYHCDLCNGSINVELGNQYMVPEIGGNYQSWPNGNNKVVEVCKTCCEILKKAKKFNIISYNEAIILSKAQDQIERAEYERLKAKFG